jgi:hypothetical protein
VNDGEAGRIVRRATFDAVQRGDVVTEMPAPHVETAESWIASHTAIAAANLHAKCVAVGMPCGVTCAAHVQAVEAETPVKWVADPKLIAREVAATRRRLTLANVKWGIYHVHSMKMRHDADCAPTCHCRFTRVESLEAAAS